MSSALKKHIWTWAPQKLSWWMFVLFMIGSTLFGVGSVLFLCQFQNTFLMALTFFIGSLFFTSAAYCQYHETINLEEGIRQWFAWKPKTVGFLAAFTQFIGTILFNLNTFDAFLDLGWLGQDLLIWVPDIAGSILFQISGTIAMFEITRRWWKPQNYNADWWMGIIGFMGCVAFMVSACLAFVTPHPLDILAQWATIFTLIGAICFFMSAYIGVLEIDEKLPE